MTLKLSSIVLFAVAINFSLTGQKFTDGFIIENSGDTIYGKIDVSSEKKNGKFCLFKTPDEKVIKYKPFDIQAFSTTNGKYYVSKKLPVDSVMTTMFAEYLIKGIADVYYYFDGQPRFIIHKRGEVPIELKNDKITHIKDGTRYVSDSKYYLRTLSYLMADSKEIQPFLKQTEFEHKSLIKLAENYHHQVCKEENCIVYQKTSNFWKFSSFGVGITNHSQRWRVNFSDRESIDFTAADNFTLVPFITFGPTFNTWLSMRLDITAAQSKSNVTLRTENTEGLITYKFNLEHFEIHVPLSIIVTYPLYKAKPYVRTGISFTYFGSKAKSPTSVSKKSHLIVDEIYFTNPDDHFIHKYKLFLSETGIGLAAGFGITYPVTDTKKIFLELNVDKSLGNLAYLENSYFDFRRILIAYKAGLLF